ncbi:MAG: zinc ABC transporter ATP-binding protein ZnuC [Candidatus Polarisedimenticolaceae bacterium]|nr:zinc ABC transporter ATP-binding protein ZnuC [Candidatus Polarisedimenticolaceae bacterium]
MHNHEITNPTPILSVSHLSLEIGGRSILQDINLHLGEREILTLIGPNGSGKSSLVRVILGLISATSGEVNLRKNLQVGYMPQHLKIDSLMPLTVSRFLLLGGKRPQKRVHEVLSEVGASQIINTPIQYISGGEMQRILLARALLREPQLLVLDEPVQGVDINGQLALYQLIQEIRDRYGCSILMISHDLHLVMAATDRVVCLNQHICCTGTPDIVTQDPAYHELFGSRQVALYSHHHDHTHSLHGNIIKTASKTEHKEHKQRG